jgi:hypothetical protein
MNIQTQPKPFAWSFSRLKNFETCARRYEAVDVKKSVVEARSPDLDRGDELHEAMRKEVNQQEGYKLPPQFMYMQTWANKLKKPISPVDIIRTEEKLAVSREGNSTGYFDKATWLRVKIDYIRITPSRVEGRDLGHIVDYKTGKPPRVWDGTQLLINAHVVFLHFKTIDKVRVDYLWTEFNDTTHDNYKRDETPQQFTEEVLPRVAKLEAAHATGVFEPKPCGLCAEYCPVSSCEHWGKRQRR